MGELRQLKVNLESSIHKWQAENADWKKKYENEARLRVEEGDALKKKFTIEVTNLTDIQHKLEQQLKSAENAKAKLSTDINVLIKDFEHSQVVVKELTAKLTSSDKSCNDLSVKLGEMANLSLNQMKIKLEDELKSFKTEMDALKKRFADADRDNRKLTHEREELARAYKKSDEDKAKAQSQVALLEKEIAKLKTEFEKKF